jgi:hypothetical protein
LSTRQRRKTCITCHERLPLTEFHANKTKKDRLQGSCKSCQSQQGRSRRDEDRRRRLNARYGFPRRVRQRPDPALWFPSQTNDYITGLVLGIVSVDPREFEGVDVSGWPPVLRFSQVARATEEHTSVDASEVELTDELKAAVVDLPEGTAVTIRVIEMDGLRPTYEVTTLEEDEWFRLTETRQRLSTQERIEQFEERQQEAEAASAQRRHLKQIDKQIASLPPKGEVPPEPKSLVEMTTEELVEALDRRPSSGPPSSGWDPTLNKSLRVPRRKPDQSWRK